MGRLVRAEPLFCGKALQNLPLIRPCGPPSPWVGKALRAAKGRPCGGVGAEPPGAQMQPSISTRKGYAASVRRQSRQRLRNGCIWERPIPPVRGKCPAGTKGVGRSKGAQRGMPTLGRSERSGLCDDEAHDGSTLEGHVSPVRDARLPSVSKHKQPGLRPVLVCISCCGPSALLTTAQRFA